MDLKLKEEGMLEVLELLEVLQIQEFPYHLLLKNCVESNLDHSCCPMHFYVDGHGSFDIDLLFS